MSHGASGAWLRFLAAAIGLALAFAAAIFSTASRDAGNVLATVILASLALLMATAVGLATVPFLARRVEARRVRDALDFEVTRSGGLYVAMVLVIGIAALNTGNNLLYIIVAAMLAAILVSGIASALCLRGLQLELKIPEHIFANVEVTARFAFAIPGNGCHRSRSARFRPKPTESARNGVGLRPASLCRLGGRRSGNGCNCQIASSAASSSKPVLEFFTNRAYFPCCPLDRSCRPRSSSSSAAVDDIRRRFSLSTRFPFAFLTKTRRVALSREVLIYPEL